jgi:hypothetical protein
LLGVARVEDPMRDELRWHAADDEQRKRGPGQSEEMPAEANDDEFDDDDDDDMDDEDEEEQDESR